MTLTFFMVIGAWKGDNFLFQLSCKEKREVRDSGGEEKRERVLKKRKQSEGEERRLREGEREREIL